MKSATSAATRAPALIAHQKRRGRLMNADAVMIPMAVNEQDELGDQDQCGLLKVAESTRGIHGRFSSVLDSHPARTSRVYGLGVFLAAAGALLLV